MTSRPSLARSIPFIVLLIASVAATALGAWIVLSKLASMTTTLTVNQQSATAALDVYGGPAWVMFGSALLGAGLLGLFGALAVATMRFWSSRRSTPTVGMSLMDSQTVREENSTLRRLCSATP